MNRRDADSSCVEGNAFAAPAPQAFLKDYELGDGLGRDETL